VGSQEQSRGAGLSQAGYAFLVPDPADITAEEILRGMIRDRIGSPKVIKLAEDLRKFMDGLSALERGIDMLGEAIRRAEDSGEPDRLADGQIAQLREIVTQCTELRSVMEASIVGAWKEGFERGWEDSAAERKREQVLATVIDLTSRMRG
jgi:hypothetical protein